MTREETIDFLECRRAYYASLSTDTSPYVKATKVCEYTLAESANACLMAIEALKKEPCSNCCNGDQIEQAKLCQKSYLAGMKHKQEPKWILVSERLPEHSERYLVTALDGTDRRITVVPYHSKNKTWILTGRIAYWRVLAWMPLPKPCKMEVVE